MKRSIKVLVVLMLVTAMMTAMFGCASNATTAEANETQKADTGGDGGAVAASGNYAVPVDPDEEYVYISLLINYPMLVEHDERGWLMACDELGVKGSVAGPTEWDVPATIATIEQTAAQKPAGIGILGLDKAFASAIDKAVDAGIPTICVDGDVPESKRLFFVGTDWANIGYKQGEAMAELIGGKGEVAGIFQLGNPNMIKAVDAFKEVLAQYPDIEYIGDYESKGNEAESATVMASIMTAYPDLAGIGCFDAQSGPGVAVAIKEANKIGEIKVTTVDIEPGQLNAINEGIIQKAFGQKRELFTYLGVQCLFILNHSAIDFAKAVDERSLGILPIPNNIDTGLIEVDASNIGEFMAKLEQE